MPIHISNVALFNPATQEGRPRRREECCRRPQGARVQDNGEQVDA
jgi:ribosomal protein L24